MAESLVATGIDGLAERLLAGYEARTPSSQAQFARANKALPGGNTRSPLDFRPYPFYVERAEGWQVVDVDDNVLIDLVNNYTSLVHGHPTPELIDVVFSQVRQGTAYGAPSMREVELAELLIARIDAAEAVRFANSGTEATLYAVRTARAFTGRDLVIKAEGGYHGGTESLQVSVKSLAPQPNVGTVEAGAPRGLVESTRLVGYNDPDGAIRAIHNAGDELAAVVVEPVQSGAGALPARVEYLKALRDATRDVGALLVFDEVMTLRLAEGGMQGHLGISPDLTALGKIIGGGFPAGAVAGRADVLGIWNPRSVPPRYHAGTYNANPVAMVAGLHALRTLTAGEIDRINRLGDRLRSSINEAARTRGVPMVASGFGSVLQLHSGTTPPTTFRDAVSRDRTPVMCVFLALLAQGIFIAPRGSMNVSTAVPDEEVARVEAAVAEAFDMLAEAGYLGDGGRA